MFKSKIVNKLINFKVYKCTPGKVIIEMKCLKIILSKHEGYEMFLKKAIMKLNGITKIELDKEKGYATINYDENEQKKENIIKWIGSIKDIGINNLDLIKLHGSRNLDYVVEIIDKKLDKEAKKYLLR